MMKGSVEDRVAVVPASDVKVLLKRGEEKKVQVEVNIPERVSAPATTDLAVGEVLSSSTELKSIKPQ